MLEPLALLVWQLLPIAVYLYLAILLFAKRRGVALAIGFALLAVMTFANFGPIPVEDVVVRPLFGDVLLNIRLVNLMFGFGIYAPPYYPWYQVLLFLVIYLFSAIIAGAKEKARSLRIIPVIVLALSFVLLFFYAIIAWLTYQYVMLSGLLLLIVLSLLSYALTAFAFYSTAVWCVYPNGKPVGAPRAASQPPYAPPQGTPAPGGPRMTTGASQQAPQRPAGPIPGAAEELKQYKELLDMGAITQEEYDQKKKQLLGL